VQIKDATLAGLMQDWLVHVYLADDHENIDDLRQDLSPGQLLVDRKGDLYSRYSISYFAAQSSTHGVIERQRELDVLARSLPDHQSALQKSTANLTAGDTRLVQLRQESQVNQQQLRIATQQHHQLNLDVQRLTQQQSHVLERQRSMQSDIAITEERLSKLGQEIAEKEKVVEQLKTALPGMQVALEQALSARRDSEQVLHEARQALQQADRQAQERLFNKKIILNNINEINNKLVSLDEEKKSLVLRLNDTQTMLEAAKMENLKSNLETALSNKQQRETELVEARNQMASADQELQAQERARLQNEQLLHPQRDKLEQARLQEQQTRLHFEQCHAELSAVGIDENVLNEGLSPSTKASQIDLKVGTTQQEIEALGPVNLAAIQELASERERKSYLDNQALDLEQAIETLEDAIRRIDKETRSRLQNTFDEANRHFGELFTTLFGGGQARLELLGEEILDTGMQVFAQPPGKKNSTIHLLSGGEKALTALALVFALFRLNPAPFCLMDEVDAPLDDSNTERFCNMVKKMSERTQFLFVSHNKITMEMAQQLIGVTMQESGVSRIVEVDIEAAMRMNAELVA
jgi:chromosome segregation protein